MKKILYVVCLSLLISCAAGCAGAPSEIHPEEIPIPQWEDGFELDPDVETAEEIAPHLTGAVAQKQTENEDVVGWLIVPGTTINTAIVQNPYKKGNQYYLDHNFDGEPDENGTYCADRRIDFGNGSREDLPLNIALYAHSFDDDPNGTLFSQLKKYRDPDFARTHPYLFFSTGAEDMVWEVFAVFDTTVDLPYVWPSLSFDTFFQVLDVVSDSSVYDYGQLITNNDHILTLSTCTFSVKGQEDLPTEIPNDYRFVVMARLLDPDEVVREEASFTVNSDVLAPDDIPYIEVA